MSTPSVDRVIWPKALIARHLLKAGHVAFHVLRRTMYCGVKLRNVDVLQNMGSAYKDKRG